MAVSRNPFMLRVITSAVRQIFPKVRQLDTESMDEWIKDEDKENFVILDVRERNEYEVSHLPEALFVNPKASAKEVIAKINEKAKKYRENVNVITYCSVGMRASTMAQRINDELEKRKEDHEGKIVNVYNLEGAIFKWTNEGKPMIDTKEKETEFCHPFSFAWGFLIPKKNRKY